MWQIWDIMITGLWITGTRIQYLYKRLLLSELSTCLLGKQCWGPTLGLGLMPDAKSTQSKDCCTVREASLQWMC